MKLRIALKAFFLSIILSATAVYLFPTPQALAGINCYDDTAGRNTNIQVESGFLSAVGGAFGLINRISDPICDSSYAKISSYFDSYTANLGHYFDQNEPGVNKTKYTGTQSHDFSNDKIDLSKNASISQSSPIFTPDSSSGGWLDGGAWKYRRIVWVNNNSAASQTDVQVKATIDTSGAQATKFVTNCTDIRVKDANNAELPYWIEETDPGTTKCPGNANTNIWVKLNVPATGTYFYIYYGNPQAITVDNRDRGDLVFPFFDDFNDGGYTDKWTRVGTTGGIQQIGGRLEISSGGTYRTHLRSNTTFSNPYYLYTSAKKGENVEIAVQWNGAVASSNNDIISNGYFAPQYDSWNAPTRMYVKRMVSGSGSGSSYSDLTLDSIFYHQYITTINQNNTIKLSFDGTEIITYSDTTYTSGYIGLSARHTPSGQVNAYYNYIFMVKWVAYGPSVFSVGEEQLPSGWLSGYQNRKRATVSNTTGGALSDYQVSFTLDPSSGLRSDCNDIRVVDMTGRVLPHWVEENDSSQTSCGVTSTVVWTKLPFIPTTGANFYIYYGNSSANNASIGNLVFDFFDDFNNSAIAFNGAKWSQAGSGGNIDQPSGALQITPNGTTRKYLKSQNSFSAPYVLETSTKRGNNVGGIYPGVEIAVHWDGVIGTVNSQIQNGYYTPQYAAWNTPTQMLLVGRAGPNQGGINTYNYSLDGNYHRYKTTTTGSNLSVNLDGISILTLTDNTRTSGNIGLSTRETPGGQVNVYYNFIFLRQYASAQPTVTLDTIETSAIFNATSGYWNFDEGSGSQTQVTDTSTPGNYANGTWATGVGEHWVSGYINKAAQFNVGANNDTINVLTNNSKLQTPLPITFSAWIKPTELGSKYILSLGPFNSIYRGATLTIVNNGGNWVAAVNFGDGGGTGLSNYMSKSGSTPLTTNKWYHIAGVIRGPNDMDIYVNGQLDTGTYSGTGRNLSYHSSFSDNSSIGSAPNAPDTYKFKGLIDEAVIYNSALTQAEVTNLYTRKLDTVGYWDFDKGANNATLYDKSNNQNNGTWSGSGSFWSPGKFNDSGLFNGVNNRVNITDTGGMYDLNELSVAFWFRSPPSPSWSSNPYFISRDKISSTSDWAVIGQQDGKIGVLIGVNGTAGNSNLISSRALNDGSWHHIVWTREASTKKNTLYIDGVQDGPAVTDNEPSINSLGTAITVGSSTSGNFLTGNIDELAIYNGALSQSQVTSIYNSGVVTQYPKLYRFSDPGNLTLNEDIFPQEVPGIIFVDGDLTINKNLVSDTNTTGLVFVVKGNTYIKSTVSQVNAFIISYGKFCDYYTGGPTCDSAPEGSNSPLTINGSVISLSENDKPKFNRKMVDNRNNQAETINFKPKYLVILKSIFGRDTNYWAEIQ